MPRGKRCQTWRHHLDGQSVLGKRIALSLEHLRSIQPEKFKFNHYDFDAGDGNIIQIAYVSPGTRNILQYLMEKHLDVVIGGLTDPTERAAHH